MQKSANKYRFKEDKEISLGSMIIRIPMIQNKVRAERIVIVIANVPFWLYWIYCTDMRYISTMSKTYYADQSSTLKFHWKDAEVIHILFGTTTV